MIFSAVEGCSRLRFLLITSPALEKTRSQGTLAGIHRNFLESLYKMGKMSALSFQYIRGSAVLLWVVDFLLTFKSNMSQRPSSAVDEDDVAAVEI